MFIFYALFFVFFTFLCWIVLQLLFYRGFFSFGSQKKVVAGRVRQVVVLYSNDWMGICLGGLSIGRFTEVVFRTGLTVTLTVN